MRLPDGLQLRDCGVYLIRNHATGKVYVGSSTNIYLRYYSHVCRLRAGVHHSSKLQNAWNHYGGGAFEFQVVALCSPAECIGLEDEWMTALDSIAHGYNIRSAAWVPLPGLSPQGNGRRGCHHSQETKDLIGAKARAHYASTGGHTASARAKMSIARKGVSKPEGFGAKVAAANAERVWTDESKARLSATQRARMTPEMRAHLACKSGERRHTDEAKRKMSVSQKGRVMSDAARKKVSEAKTAYWAAQHAAGTACGGKRSPEARERMSAAQKESWKRRKKQEVT